LSPIVCLTTPIPFTKVLASLPVPSFKIIFSIFEIPSSLNCQVLEKTFFISDSPKTLINGSAYFSFSPDKDSASPLPPFLSSSLLLAPSSYSFSKFYGA
jgi:hypothetical protein